MIQVGWIGGQSVFHDQLKRLTARGLTTMGQALGETLKFLNTNRMINATDYYGHGRWFIGIGFIYILGKVCDSHMMPAEEKTNSNVGMQIVLDDKIRSSEEYAIFSNLKFRT